MDKLFLDDLREPEVKELKKFGAWYIMKEPIYGYDAKEPRSHRHHLWQRLLKRLF